MARGRQTSRKTKKNAAEKKGSGASVVEKGAKEEKQEDAQVKRDRSNVRRGTGGKGAPTKVTIEHCKAAPVFKQTANKVVDAITKEFPDIQSEVNPEQPRSKSFEITITFTDGSEELVWSGIELGPPRTLKFPESDKIVNTIKEFV